MTTLRKTWHLIGREDRRRLAILVPIALIVSGVEVVGAGLVYSLLGIATGATDGVTLPLLGDVRDLFDIDREVLLLAVAAAMGAFFLMKAVVRVGQTYVQSRVVLRMGARLASRLMAGYLALPYAFHLQRSSSELIRNTNSAVQEIFTEVVKPWVKLVAEALLVIGMLTLLVFVAPLATAAAVVVLGSAALVLLAVIQPRLKRLGARHHRLKKETLQTLQQSFHGVRDVKLLAGERSFGRRYRRQREQVARVGYLRATLDELPGTVVELALLGFILLVFGAMVVVGQDTPATLTVLGLFAYVGQRLQSSVQSIIRALNQLKYSSAPVDDLHADLLLIAGREDAASVEPPLPFEREIRLEQVSFRYDGAHRDALDQVSLVIPRGEVLGICGPTGGGKTTLVDVITGLLTPTQGRVTVDGLDLVDHARAWQRNLGVVPQMVFLVDASLRENIALAERADRIDEEALQEAVDLAQLREFVDSLPDGLDTVVGERGVRISGGQRQRVAIARALYRRPSVVVFDEGTSALDNATEREVMAALERLRRDHTILLVAHRLSTVRNADRIVLLQDGKVQALGPYEELLVTSPEFASLAGA